MHTRRKRLLFCLALPLGTGALSALWTMEAMKAFASLHQPPASPPGWMFSAVWTVLYILMGYASFRILELPETPERIRAWRLYVLQLSLNFFWPILFFLLAWHEFAFLWLLILGVAAAFTLRAFFALDRVAGKLLIPYLFWLLFAAYLNLGVAVLN